MCEIARPPLIDAGRVLVEASAVPATDEVPGDARALSAELRSLREENREFRERHLKQEADRDWWWEESRRHQADKAWFREECDRLSAALRTQQWDVRISSPLTASEAWAGYYYYYYCYYYYYHFYFY